MNVEETYGSWGIVLGLIMLALFFLTKDIPMRTKIEACIKLIIRNAYGVPERIFVWDLT